MKGKEERRKKKEKKRKEKILLRDVKKFTTRCYSISTQRIKQRDKHRTFC